MGWGNTGLRWWEHAIERRTRVGGPGLPVKNRATRARFWLARCGGVLIWEEGTCLGWGNTGLRWWECVIEQRARVGWTRAPRQKPSRWGSVLVGDMRGTSYMDSGDLFGGGDTQFERVGVPDKL